MKTIFRGFRIYNSDVSGVEQEYRIKTSFYLEDVVYWESGTYDTFKSKTIVTYINFKNSDPIYIAMDFVAFDLLMDNFNKNVLPEMFNIKKN